MSSVSEDVAVQQALLGGWFLGGGVRGVDLLRFPLLHLLGDATEGVRTKMTQKRRGRGKTRQ